MSLRERAEQIKKSKAPPPLEEDCGVCEALGATVGGDLANLTKDLAPASSPLSVPLSPGLGSPPDIGELGRASWTLLHSVAAYYPKQASAEEQKSAKALLDSFAALFPCRWCARDFAEIMQAKPPQLEGRQSFSLWLCEAHNEVNRQLGKDEFNCSMVDKRWRRAVNDD